MHKYSKIIRLLKLLPTRPGEVWTRIELGLAGRIDSGGRQADLYQATEWQEALRDLGAATSTDIDEILQEESLRTVEQEVSEGIQRMPPNAPFGMFHNGDFRLARLCYVLARIGRPKCIVETGVCYGVTSAFLLMAISVNGSGVLHSIDLPPLSEQGDLFVGTLVPNALKQYWKLHRGASKQLLPRILKEAGEIGLFIHDSLHTYSNMRWEIEVATKFLERPAFIVADDIHGNNAFCEWAAKTKPDYWAAVREQSKETLFGIAALINAQS